MKKIISLFAFVLTLGVVAIPGALAALPAGNYNLDLTAEKAQYTTNGVPSDTIESLSSKVIKGFLSMMVVFFMGLMLYGGIRWMTAHGNEEFVEKAKNIIQAAIIGLGLMLAARALANLVLRATGG